MAYDPEFEQAAAKTFKRLGLPVDRPMPRFPRGDIKSRRQSEAFIKAILSLDPEQYTNIDRTEYKIPGYEGAELSLFAYRKNAQIATSEPAVLYIHGGGMILGSPQLFEPRVKADVAATGVTHFSIQYRLAPENRHPTPVEDCYGALIWLSTHAQEVGIDPARVGIAGLSAGGGLAAGVALLARDRGLYPPVAKQILLCPMLDDRNIVTDLNLLPLMTWSWDDNWTGWNALLGSEPGSNMVSPYAAPARAVDLKGLPSTYIDVGSLDIFADENRMYVERLRTAGVEVEWHLYDGVPHGFELRGVGSRVVKQAHSNRRAALRSF